VLSRKRKGMGWQREEERAGGGLVTRKKELGQASCCWASHGKGKKIKKSKGKSGSARDSAQEALGLIRVFFIFQISFKFKFDSNFK
jgi:hypothetical protein